MAAMKAVRSAAARAAGMQGSATMARPMSGPLPPNQRHRRSGVQATDPHEAARIEIAGPAEDFSQGQRVEEKAE